MAGRRIAVLVAAALAFTPAAIAQETSSNATQNFDNWSAHVLEDQGICFAVSQPLATDNFYEGTDRRKDANRGDIRLFVTFIPESNVNGEVSYRGGYTFKDETPIEIKIGDDVFYLYALQQDEGGDAEVAWARTSAEDAQITAAMRAGAEALVIGHSNRGTRTEDRLSLIGFTAAVEFAETRCQGN